MLKGWGRSQGMRIDGILQAQQSVGVLSGLTLQGCPLDSHCRGPLWTHTAGCPLWTHSAGVPSGLTRQRSPLRLTALGPYPATLPLCVCICKMGTMWEPSWGCWEGKMRSYIWSSRRVLDLKSSVGVRYCGYCSVSRVAPDSVCIPQSFNFFLWKKKIELYDILIHYHRKYI